MEENADQIGVKTRQSCRYITHIRSLRVFPSICGIVALTIALILHTCICRERERWGEWSGSFTDHIGKVNPHLQYGLTLSQLISCNLDVGHKHLIFCIFLCVVTVCRKPAHIVLLSSGFGCSALTQATRVESWWRKFSHICPTGEKELSV